jgi:hypothetical protein
MQCTPGIFAVTSIGYQSGKRAKIWGPSEHTALECLQGVDNSNNSQPAGVFYCLTVGLSGRAVLHDATIWQVAISHVSAGLALA